MHLTRPAAQSPLRLCLWMVAALSTAGLAAGCGDDAEDAGADSGSDAGTAADGDAGSGDTTDTGTTADADAALPDDAHDGSGADEDTVPPPPSPEYPLDDTLRVDEITMKCTHNSYHVRPEFLADPSHDYTHLPLDQQMELQGVRAFELDIHAGEGFPVFHIPYGIDDVSTCPDLGACLGTIRSWSVQNPGHHLVVVWMEIKDELDLERITDYDALDATVREALGDRLYTPDDFRRGYETPRAALEAEGWPTLGETRNRVLVVILDVEEPHQNGYTREYTTLDGRAMFVRAREDQYTLPWAVIAKINNPAAAEDIAAAHEAGMLIASNTGSAGNTEEEAEAKRAAGVANGVHMLCDDFVGPEGGQPTWLSFADGRPSTCNTARASEACTPGDLERLDEVQP